MEKKRTDSVDLYINMNYISDFFCVTFGTLMCMILCRVLSFSEQACQLACGREFPFICARFVWVHCLLFILFVQFSP